MSTARTCTTPKDGWALYHHFLGNLLLVIRMQGEDYQKEESEENRDKRERIISDTWAELTGHLYMIMRRMQANGHLEDAAKMQQLVDMTVELDLTDPAVCEAIHAKNEELYIPAREFKEIVERLRAEHAK